MTEQEIEAVVERVLARQADARVAALTRSPMLRQELLAILRPHMEAARTWQDHDVSADVRIVQTVSALVRENGTMRKRLAAAEKRAAELGVERRRLYERARKAEGKL